MVVIGWCLVSQWLCREAARKWRGCPFLKQETALLRMLPVLPVPLGLLRLLTLLPVLPVLLTLLPLLVGAVSQPGLPNQHLLPQVPVLCRLQQLLWEHQHLGGARHPPSILPSRPLRRRPGPPPHQKHPPGPGNHTLPGRRQRRQSSPTPGPGAPFQERPTLSILPEAALPGKGRQRSGPRPLPRPSPALAPSEPTGGATRRPSSHQCPPLHRLSALPGPSSLARRAR